MPADFSFETQEKYKTFAGRRAKRMYDVAILYLIILIAGLIYWGFISHDPFTIMEILLYVGGFVLLGALVTLPAIYRVRNYIIKMVCEHGVITIDYAHYNTVTHYSGKPNDFEIEMKESIFVSSKYRTHYYLKIKLLKDYIIIKQGEQLDWKEKTMADFIAAIQEPVSNN